MAASEVHWYQSNNPEIEEQFLATLFDPERSAYDALDVIEQLPADDIDTTMALADVGIILREEYDSDAPDWEKASVVLAWAAKRFFEAWGESSQDVIDEKQLHCAARIAFNQIATGELLYAQEMARELAPFVVKSRNARLPEGQRRLISDAEIFVLTDLIEPSNPVRNDLTGVIKTENWRSISRADTVAARAFAMYESGEFELAQEVLASHAEPGADVELFLGDKLIERIHHLLPSDLGVAEELFSKALAPILDKLSPLEYLRFISSYPSQAPAVMVDLKKAPRLGAIMESAQRLIEQGDEEALEIDAEYRILSIAVRVGALQRLKGVDIKSEEFMLDYLSPDPSKAFTLGYLHPHDEKQIIEALQSISLEQITALLYLREQKRSKEGDAD